MSAMGPDSGTVGGARPVAVRYLLEARRTRNGTYRSWDIFRQASLAAAEECAHWVLAGVDSPAPSVLALQNAAAWQLLNDRYFRALAAHGGAR